MERPIDETTWGRARHDFVAAAQTFRFWAAQVVSLPIAGGLAASMAPGSWSDTETTWFAASISIASATMLASAVYAGAFVLAPVRQRNEARDEVRQNKAQLILDIRTLAGLVLITGSNILPLGDGVIYQLGDILIINRTGRKVLLRLRLSLLVTENEHEVIYARASCPEQHGPYVSQEGAIVPHLPAEIPLEADEHTRGHAEFVLDMKYMQANYSSFELPLLDGYWFEAEDLLTAQVTRFEIELPERKLEQG